MSPIKTPSYFLFVHPLTMHLLLLVHSFFSIESSFFASLYLFDDLHEGRPRGTHRMKSFSLATERAYSMVLNGVSGLSPIPASSFPLEKLTHQTTPSFFCSFTHTSPSDMTFSYWCAALSGLPADKKYFPNFLYASPRFFPSTVASAKT